MCLAKRIRIYDVELIQKYNLLLVLHGNSLDCMLQIGTASIGTAHCYPTQGNHCTRNISYHCVSGSNLNESRLRPYMFNKTLSGQQKSNSVMYVWLLKNMYVTCIDAL
jgi:hypothetical protein